VGKKVNVVLWDGTVRSVDEETAARLGAPNARRETDQENLSRAVQQGNAQRSAGFHEGAKAAAEGLADTVTGGIFGKVVGATDPEWAENMRVRGQERPGARMLGTAVGFAAPHGAIGKLGGEATAVGLTARAGRAVEGATGSVAVGRLAEGALLGAQAKIAETNVTGDRLTIEGTLEAAGIDGVLNWGIGALADRVLGSGVRAQAAVNQRGALKADLDLAAEGKSTLSQARNEKYAAFKQTHDDYAKHVRSENAKAAREAADYAKATSKESANAAVKKLRDTRAQVHAELQETTYGRGVKKQFDEAQKARKAWETEKAATDQAHGRLDKRQAKEFERDQRRTQAEFERDQQRAQTDYDREVAGLESDYERQVKKDTAQFERDRGSYEQFISSYRLPEALSGGKSGGKRSIDAALGELDKLAKRGKPGKPAPTGKKGGYPGQQAETPTTPDAPDGAHAERYKEFKLRRSQLSQKLGKGWQGKPGRWEPGGAPDVEGAVEELHKLVRDIRTAYPSGTVASMLPDVPRVPKRVTRARPEHPSRPESAAAPEPGEFTPGERPEFREAPTPFDGTGTGPVPPDARALADRASDLTNTLNAAHKHIREGRYASAFDEIGAAEARAREAGMGHLEFPRQPVTPRPQLAVDTVDGLPKNLEQFARMTPDKVARLANSVEQMDPTVAEAFGQLADDLGLARRETSAETVAAVHDTLKRYPAAFDRMAARELADQAKEAAKSGKAGIFTKGTRFAKRGIQYVAARSVDIGGTKGAIARVLMGGGVGYALDGAEGAAVGGALFAGKAGIRAKLSDLVAKFAPRTGRAMHTLRPVTGYLAAQFPDGEDDPDTDVRKQAGNRIMDVYRAAMTAPDAAFLAVEGTVGHEGDVAWKMHNHVINALNHLVQFAPKDPGLDVTLSGSNWTPSAAQSLEYAHRIEAVVDPLGAIARSVSGDSHPAAAEALWTVWPAIMQDYAQEFMLSDRSGLTYEAESRMARLLRIETGLRQPAVLASLQGLYLPQPTQPGGGSTPSAPSGKPVGRPAAVQSPVAGSSVSALIS
jgi:hypothetical protein